MEKTCNLWMSPWRMHKVEKSSKGAGLPNWVKNDYAPLSCTETLSHLGLGPGTFLLGRVRSKVFPTRGWECLNWVEPWGLSRRTPEIQIKQQVWVYPEDWRPETGQDQAEESGRPLPMNRSQGSSSHAETWPISLPEVQLISPLQSGLGFCFLALASSFFP